MLLLSESLPYHPSHTLQVVLVHSRFIAHVGTYYPNYRLKITNKTTPGGKQFLP